MNKMEAAVALCKCPESHRIYGVRFEQMEEGGWRYTWAFPIRSSSARREGYDSTIIDGYIQMAEGYPGCPYCGSKAFIICGCGRLNCDVLTGGKFKCGWCGQGGDLIEYDGGGFSGGGDR